MRQRFLIQACLLALAGLITNAYAGEVIRGAGATFPAPVYQAWAAAYEKAHGVRVTYEAVGSGAGIEQIRRKQVDFGATDAPLNAEELTRAGLTEFPVIVGGVVPVINQMMGIKPGALRLSGPVLADIYLGRIRKWNDPAIAALNPSISLPGSNITVVHRSEPSGSSLLWTNYLARSSPQWQSRVGASLSPRWPTGVGGTGNEGVASYVQRTRYSLGYVEYTYARRHNLSDVSLRNHSGQFVQASRTAFEAAVQAANLAGAAGTSGSTQLPSDLPGNETWPMTGASFILVGPGGHRAEVLHFFDWALHDGANLARELDYLPAPASVMEPLQP